MMDRNTFERGLAGEPTLGVDFAAVQQRGSVLVRRRRTVAVSTVTGAAVVIVLGAALIPRMSGVDNASPAQIPGCAVVLGPTDTQSPPTGGPVDRIATTGETLLELTGTTVEPSAAATDPGIATEPDAATELGTVTPSEPAGELITTAADPTADPTILPPPASAGDGVFNDLTQPPDPLTAVFWQHLQAWGVSAHAVSQLGDLAFYAYPQPDLPVAQASISASGWAVSDRGEGEVFISVGPNDQGGPPECRAGELDRRVTYADGTVVDVSDNNSMAYSNLSDVGVPVTQYHAIAYKPDGTQVIAFATNAVELGDVNPETAGTSPTQAPPLTLDQVQQLVIDPTFSKGSAAFAQALAYSSTLVPDVVGLSEQDAVAALQQAGFTVDPDVQAAVAAPDPVDGAAADDAVIGQSPAGGDPVAPNGAVQLTTATTSTAATTSTSDAP